MSKSDNQKTKKIVNTRHLKKEKGKRAMKLKKSPSAPFEQKTLPELLPLNFDSILQEEPTDVELKEAHSVENPKEAVS